WFKEKKYIPMQTKELIKLVVKFKKNIVPRWVRIHRLVRDLTKNDVAVQTFPSNFRQELQSELYKNQVKCFCIRCREIKDQKIHGKIQIKITKYNASDGIEYFIEAIDENESIMGFLRLRIPEYFLKKKSFFISSLNGAVMIRELHVYGQQIPIGDDGSVQHTGLGTELLKHAEDIALKHKAKNIAVISGVGVRQYYRKFGYELVEGEYMIKKLLI
ncbi:MAG: GNAT family N-acetyltransferase, partial [bacterium]|nr:GNAT family N-acetyltransferase [bacterium]